VSTLLGNAAKGLPALVGILSGIVLYWLGMRALWQPFLAIALGYLFLFIGRFSLGKAPLLGWLFIELWVIASIGVLALGAALVLHLTIILPRVISSQGEEGKTIAGALVGAVTAYLAILWTKDIQEANGPFWPGTQYKNAIGAAFAAPEVAPKGATLQWEAIYLDRLQNGVTGWGFSARFQRSLIMADHLRQVRGR
jgi:hypothetical protein